jgi:hypothetical protein
MKLKTTQQLRQDRLALSQIAFLKVVSPAAYAWRYRILINS